MAIKIVISDIVGFKVEGTINDEKGAPQPFNFTLTATRMSWAKFQEKMKEEGERPILEFLEQIIIDWGGVRDENDAPIKYSVQALRSLCETIPGVAALAYHTYIREIGAKAKN